MTLRADSWTCLNARWPRFWLAVLWVLLSVWSGNAHIPKTHVAEPGRLPFTNLAQPTGARNSSSALASAPLVENLSQSPNALPSACPSRADVDVRAPMATADGELLRATGPLAFANPFLFSTKHHDWETGLYYYGYRYYSPEWGR